MFNQKFNIQCDFVDSFLNRIILEHKHRNEDITNDAKVFEACVNLNTFNLNFSECGVKRDRVNTFFEDNGLNGFKQQVTESCSNELLEAHSLVYLQHRNNFNNLLSKVINQIAIRESLQNLSECINKI